MTDLMLSTTTLKIRVFGVLRIVIAAIARFVLSLYYGSCGESIPPIADDILKQPAVEVAKKIRTKQITSVEALEACIRRIKDVNSTLNCVVDNRFELALKEAKEADALIASGKLTGEQLLKDKPFLGVPFTIKDSVAVKGLHLTSGLVSRKDVIADHDADVVKLLKDKGAIIIGSTNVPELCMWWETNNHIYGRTKNPYNTTRMVGGSSGGEGCLQAVAGSCFGIGTDIGGSIRMPAYFNGIFGHKTTRNIVSNRGQFPEVEDDMTHALLSTGPMTRHAVDLKPILEIISGDMKGKLNLDKPVDVQKLKVYYQISCNDPMVDKVDPEIKTALEKVVEFFDVKHKIKAEKITIERFKNSYDIWLNNLKTNKPFGKELMANYSYKKTLVEVMKNIVGCSGNTLVALLSALAEDNVAPLGSDENKYYLKVREDLEKEIKNILGDDGILLYPTHPTTAIYHNESYFKYRNFVYTGIINCLGFPSTNVPLGLSREGLPIGIQVIANHNNDRLCLAVAETLDKAFGGWKEP